MLSILGFLIILGPLVIVHEFGHYFFARLFGVKAEIFSVGFGPKLWSRPWGETELRLSAIPLGGYVKLLGEDPNAPLPPEESARALHRQANWKRFFIFFGGPLFNFIFAALVFMAILVIGEPQLANVVGRVVRGSVAEKAGFQSGDRVLSVDAKAIHRYDELMAMINEKPGQKVVLDVEHVSGSRQKIQVVPSLQEGFSMYGEMTTLGEVPGLSPVGRGLALGVSNPSSVVGKAGLKTGDEIVAIQGHEVSSWEELERLYDELPPGQPVQMGVRRAGVILPQTATSWVKPASQGGAGPALSLAQAWGLHSIELFIDKTVASSPAEKAGLKSGDRLIGIGAQDVQSFLDLKTAVQDAGEKSGQIEVRWERDGKLFSETITPTSNASRDATLKKTIQYTIGVMPIISIAEPVTLTERVWNPLVLAWKGTERMVVFTWRNFVSIKKMITGDVSLTTLGGPILIGKIAGESITRGLIAFLSTMAALSVGLGVLNVLPIPVLDGGHILLLLVESVRRKPLTLRQLEFIQGAGLVFILGLMGIVMRNDIIRLPFFGNR